MTRKRKTIELIATHGPPHNDEVFRIVEHMLFGNALINPSYVQWHFSTDAGLSITPKMRELEQAGRALLVGVGGSSRDDEHGKTFKSAAAMPLEGLRENFDRVCRENGLRDHELDAAWARLQDRITFATIRDSSRTGNPLDLAGLVKSWGYTRLFPRAPDIVDVTAGDFGEADMRILLDWVRILLVGWILMPHATVGADEQGDLDSLLSDWVYRHIYWDDMPERDMSRPQQLTHLMNSVSRKREPIVHRRLRALFGHWSDICLTQFEPWDPSVRFRKLLRNDAQFDGARPECPEAFCNMLLQIHRRELMGRSVYQRGLPRRIQDTLALPEGSTQAFLDTFLGVWHDDQWLFVIQGSQEARREGVVERWAPQGGDGSLAVINAKGPYIATHVRKDQRQRTQLMLVRNALYDTHLFALNLDGIGEAAVRNGLTVDRFADRVMRHTAALVRMHELHAAGVAIPWKTKDHPADILFMDDQLPKELLNPDVWYAATDGEGRIHSLMNGSLIHRDVPKTRQSRQELREIAMVVQTAIASDDVTRAFRAEFARLARLWRTES